MTEKFILDATAGFRMMWFNKQHPNTLYLDNRPECNPDIVGDFRELSQFPDETFRLIVFDPPHCQISKTNKGIFKERFGRINTATWQKDFYRAFKELYRILRPYGILIFKWNSHDISTNRILSVIDGWRPLFGSKTTERTKHSSKTWWFCFMKIPEAAPP